MSDSKKDAYNLSLSTGDSNFRSSFSSSLMNDHHVFVVQKTEKLASAVYMITSNMSVTEPLRTKLRSCALDLISCTADIEQSLRSRNDFGSRCLEIGTILRLSERSGLVSVMNAKILCEEYGALSSFVHDHEDLIFAERITPGMRVFEKPKQISIGQNKGQEILRTNNDKRHSNRQEEILSLFSKKDRISIKDAVSAIDGCSEKTIQREIMALVEEGVLIKEGERRWSTYRKVQTA